jgi:hypothetical protein
MPGNIYISYGTAIHGALEYNFRQKIKSREDRPYKEVEAEFHRIMANEYDRLTDAGVRTYGNVYDKLIMQGEEMLYKYMKEVAPKHQPIAVEQKFEIELKSYPVTIY